MYLWSWFILSETFLVLRFRAKLIEINKKRFIPLTSKFQINTLQQNFVFYLSNFVHFRLVPNFHELLAWYLKIKKLIVEIKSTEYDRNVLFF